MEKQLTVHSGDRTNKNLINVPNTVPWGMLNEEWAERNHSQTLTKLNERGGLGVLEMLNNIDKKRLDFRAPTQLEVDRLNKLIEFYLAPPKTMKQEIEELAKQASENIYKSNNLLDSYNFSNQELDEIKTFGFQDGFIAGYSQDMEQPKWISVRTDIVIPNEMLIVHYESGEMEIIFYDELILPNFTHWMPLPLPPNQTK